MLRLELLVCAACCLTACMGDRYTASTRRGGLGDGDGTSMGGLPSLEMFGGPVELESASSDGDSSGGSGSGGGWSGETETDTLSGIAYSFLEVSCAVPSSGAAATVGSFRLACLGVAIIKRRPGVAADPCLHVLQPFLIANGYGLFRDLTGVGPSVLDSHGRVVAQVTRPELIIEVSHGQNCDKQAQADGARPSALAIAAKRGSID